jgi:hypothetical protein
VLAAIYLENIGAAAFGRPVVRSALVPTAGALTGRIELDMKGSSLGCRTNVTLQNVSYGLNPTAPLRLVNRAQIERELASLQVNRGVFASCNDDVARPGFRFVQTVQTALTQEALADASPSVRRVAMVDYRRVTNQVLDQAVTAAGDAISRKAGEIVGNALGTTVDDGIGQCVFCAAAATEKRSETQRRFTRAQKCRFGIQEAVWQRGQEEEPMRLRPECVEGRIADCGLRIAD